MPLLGLLLTACAHDPQEAVAERVYQTGREIARRACFAQATQAQVQECLRQQAQSYEDYRQQREKISPP